LIKSYYALECSVYTNQSTGLLLLSRHVMLAQLTTEHDRMLKQMNKSGTLDIFRLKHNTTFGNN